MFDSYITIRQLDKNGRSMLIRDRDTDLYAVRKHISPDLTETYERVRSVSHPCLSEVYFVRRETGGVFAYCAWIEGETLEDRLQKDVTEAEALTWMLDILDALSCLHAVRPMIVHRDVKPSNVVIDTEGRAHLIDYGAARVYKPSSGSDTNAIGTRGYAAPEQYGFGQSDARTDIYACGILLNELMTRAGAKAKYARVIGRCTHIFPNKRYASAGALKRALFLRRERKVLRIAMSVACVAALCTVMILSRAFFRDPGGTSNEMGDDASVISGPIKRDPAEAGAGERMEAAGQHEASGVAHHVEEDRIVSLLTARFGPYENERTVSWETALHDGILNDLTGNDPMTLYRILITQDTDSSEDILVPPNAEMQIDPGRTLRFINGSTLTNYGVIRVRGKAQLLLDDGTRLDCGGVLIGDNGERFRPHITAEKDAILRFGAYTEITRDKTRDSEVKAVYELINLQDARIRFDSPDTTRITLGAGGYVSMYVRDPQQMDENVLLPFLNPETGRAEGVSICYRPDSTEALFRTIPELSGELCDCVFSTLFLTSFPPGVELRAGPRTQMAVPKDFTLETGSVLELESPMVLHDGVTFTIERGAAFRYEPDYIACGKGSLILVKDGADVRISGAAQGLLGDRIRFEAGIGQETGA